MPLIEMTTELIKIIKDERSKNKITGEVLASAIGKTRAYISQIENGKVPLIDIDTLRSILQAATKLKGDEFNLYINDLLKRISATVNLDAMEREEWMFIFDLQIREFNVSNTIIDFIKAKCNELNITYKNLVHEINKNKGLEFSSTFEPNKVKVIIQKDTVGTAIRFEFEEDFVDKIVSKNITKINYINLLGIIYNIFLLENHTDETAKILAEQFLQSNDIITILDRDRKKRDNLKHKLETGEEFDPEANEVTKNDKEFAKEYTKTKFWLEHLNDAKPDEAFEYLSVLNKNFEIDWKLMFAIMSSPIFKLKVLPFSVRKDFFTEYKELLKKYIEKTKGINDEQEYL